MKHFTLFSNLCRKALSLVMFLVVAGTAFAADFGPTPTSYNVTNLNGEYEVLFATIKESNLDVSIVTQEGITLVDAAGVAVPYAFVTPMMKDDYTVVFSVGGADNAAAGTYKIKVPQNMFTYMSMVNNDAFDITLNLNNGTDPVGPVDPDVDPTVQPQDGDVVFSLDDHKSDTSIYFQEGSIIESNGAGVLLKFTRTAVDSQGYTYCYKSNGGFVQFKDCAFTISVPAGVTIQKIVFTDGAPLSTTYDLDNFVADGYADGVWTGNAQSVSFATKEIQYPIYDYDEETDEEYITGYTTSTTGARVAKIYLTVNGIIDGIERLDASAPVTVVYDLAGRRADAAKGIVIANGKKVIR